MKKGLKLFIYISSALLLFGFIILFDFLFDKSIDWVNAMGVTFIFTSIDIIGVRSYINKCENRKPTSKENRKFFLILLLIFVGVLSLWYGFQYFYVNTKKVNENILELSVKKALIEVVNERNYKDVSNKEGTTGAEGHKILKSEVKDNQIYAYVVAEYGVYKLEDSEVTPVSANASPITLIFDMNETFGYNMIKYLVPSDEGDEAWLASLKEMFPEELIAEAKSINYKDDYYQNQIKEYVETLKNDITTNNDSNTDTKQLLLDVMNNKKKFIDEDNKEVFLKNFEIVENQTAKVYKYAFVDMDKDGIEELVIYTTSDYGAYVILHYENNKVYGYMIGVRSLENLKADGSFMGSSGANYNEYSRMTFNKNSYSIETEAVYDVTDKIYKINNAKVSEKEIKEYVDNWNKKENVNWSK